MRILVYAAEQMKLKGIIEDKFGYVQEQLALKGFTVDLNAIQAMVREMNGNGDAAPKNRIVSYDTKHRLSFGWGFFVALLFIAMLIARSQQLQQAKALRKSFNQ